MPVACGHEIHDCGEKKAGEGRTTKRREDGRKKGGREAGKGQKGNHVILVISLSNK